MRPHDRLVQGDHVEVRQVWASQGACRPPLRAWFSGYTFESRVGDVVRVRSLKGLSAGLVLNYSACDVRRHEGCVSCIHGRDGHKGEHLPGTFISKDGKLVVPRASED